MKPKLYVEPTGQDKKYKAPYPFPAGSQEPPMVPTAAGFVPASLIYEDYAKAVLMIEVHIRKNFLPGLNKLEKILEVQRRAKR
jgi:hypothetical protein